MRRAWNLAASAFFAIPLVGGWTGSGASATGRALLIVLGATTLARPGWGLLLMCGLIPMIDPAVVATASPVLAEQVVLTFLVTATARLAFAHDSGVGRLARPGIVLGLLVLVSGALAVSHNQQLVTPTPDPFLRALWSHLSSDYYGGLAWFDMVNRVMAWIEAIALALVAERLARTNATGGQDLLTMLVIAGGAFGLFSGIHLVEVAIGSLEPWRTAVHTVVHARFNPFYRDINAAASVYALFLAPALWLAWRARQRIAAVGALMLTLGLWLAGSRAARGSCSPRRSWARAWASSTRRSSTSRCPRWSATSARVSAPCSGS